MQDQRMFCAASGHRGTVQIPTPQAMEVLSPVVPAMRRNGVAISRAEYHHAGFEDKETSFASRSMARVDAEQHDWQRQRRGKLYLSE